MSSIRIIKRKARGFFKSHDIPTIKNTILSCHQIITNASILLRAYYLRWFQENCPLQDDQHPLQFEKHHVSIACSIIQGSTTPSVRKTGQDEKIAFFTDLLDEYHKLYGRLESVQSIETEESMSHILSYSMENLLTAYENNIHGHFHKYPKRYIRCDMMSKGADLKTAKKVAGIFTNTYLYDSPFELESTVLETYNLSLDSYGFLFPPKRTEKGLPRCWDLKVHPWVYLPKMVMINQALETDFPMVPSKHRKLLNPLPFHSSFVPMHIRVDTSGLCQLLMNKEKINDFKTLYNAEHGVDLNMKNKSDMLSSFEKLFGREATSNKEAGQYATELWSYLTNLKTCRQWKEVDGVVRKNDPNKRKWIFDNSVMTDGISISLQVIDEKEFGRKVLTGRKKSKKTVDVEEDCKSTITPKDLEKYKALGIDPGKKDIVAVTDGIKTICYTKGQRDIDTYKATRVKASLRKRRGSGLEVYETQILSRFSKRSCHPEVFQRYACTRKRFEQLSTTCYSHPMFREFKFLVKSRTKSSEDRFIRKVFNTFKRPNEEVKPCVTEKMRTNASKAVERWDQFVIGWGNWGKTPNAVKCGGPTPGIGIRRHFESFFKTVTIDERLSSQTCPCCKNERCMKKVTIGTVPIQRHHLLRCTNETCESRLWNRNVVGAFNILDRLLEPRVLGNETTKSGLPRRRRPPKPRT